MTERITSMKGWAWRSPMLVLLLSRFLVFSITRAYIDNPRLTCNT